METLSLKLSPRTVMGKKVRRLRRDGIVPVHLFGQGIGPQALQVEVGELRRLLIRAGRNVPVAIELEEQKGENICFVREVQRHPVTDILLHVDFLRVDVSQTITADVPVILDGEAPAVTDSGGILLQGLYSVSVESLPMNMPASFVLDISGLDDFDKTIRVNVVEAGAGVTILTAPEEMIATVVPPRIEEEPEAAEELGEELAEGEEAAEGAEAEAGPEQAEDQARGR